MHDTLILRGLQIVLVIGIITMLFIYYHQIKKAGLKWHHGGLKAFIIGFITDFGDTIGIGSFATTTAAFKVTHFLDDDRNLPGTMNAVHAVPTMFEALFFLTAVKIDWRTFIVMTVASILGALIGPRLTANWDAQKIRGVLAWMLVLAAIVMLYNIFFLPVPGMGKNALVGWQLWLGFGFNFLLGIMMTLGLGNYTPELIFFSLMGMNPLVAYPVMMMNSAVVMTTAASGFIRTKRIQWWGLGMIVLGGIFGVIVAATLVRNINVSIIRYGIVALSLWTAYSLWKESRKVLAIESAVENQ